MAQDTSTPQELDNPKEVAFYTATVEAWFNTRLEKSKQLLTLSSLAIGLLMIFYNELDTGWEFFVWLLAGLCFISCIVLSLWILDQNADYLTAMVNRHESESRLSDSLKWKAKSSAIMFGAGAVLAFFLAIMATGFTLQKSVKTEPFNLSIRYMEIAHDEPR